MTGGSLSLTSTRGTGQDVININPQITFFKKIYKRHTNFGIEAIQQTLLSTPSFGQSTEITLSKTGSLITDMHFEFTLPPAAGDNGLNTEDGRTITNPNGTGIGCVDNYQDTACWVNAVGFAIINEIKLKFGSTIIDKHTGLWYDIWNELTDPNRKEWPLVGKFDDEDRNGALDLDYSRYYVPLKFYFNRNSGLAIPIFLLNENELKIDISLKSLESLLNFNERTDNNAIDPVINQRSLLNFKFYANYIFLEKEEEAKIQNSLPSEYLVETLDIHDNINTNNVSNLIFENPTKEFIWVFRHPDRIKEGSVTNIPRFNSEDGITTSPNDIFNYSKVSKNNDLKYGTNDPFSSLLIQINNNDRFDRTDATFFRTVQPYKYHSNIPGGISKNKKKQYIYVYSFALKPEDYQPSGSYNFSIGDDKTSFNFQGPSATSAPDPVEIGLEDYNLTIFAVRYEYIVFNFGRVTVSRVPIQSTYQKANEEAASEEAAYEDAESLSSNRPINNNAVKSEITRRYVKEVPYLYNQRLGKKKWSGLEGDFFNEQKKKDLGETIIKKKKDIF